MVHMVLVVEVVTMEEVEQLTDIGFLVLVEVFYLIITDFLFITRLYICISSCDRRIKLYRRM